MLIFLNGKAEEDFIKWASYTYGEDSGDISMMRSTYRDALIIEWFDSVGIYIGVYPNNNMSSFISFEISINDDWIGEGVDRKKATEEAIVKASEVYNKQFK